MKLFIAIALLATPALCQDDEVPDGYNVYDRSFDHRQVGISRDKSGDVAGALESFKAACRFVGGDRDFANFGVALLRAGNSAPNLNMVRS